MLLAGRVEADGGPFFGRRAEVPGVAGEEDGDAVVVFGQRRAVAGAEAVELGAVGVKPAGGLVGRAVESVRKPVFGLKAGLQHVQLQGADYADDPIAAV